MTSFCVRHLIGHAGTHLMAKHLRTSNYHNHTVCNHMYSISSLFYYNKLHFFRKALDLGAWLWGFVIYKTLWSLEFFHSNPNTPCPPGACFVCISQGLFVMLGSSKGIMSCYSIQRHSIQLCVAKCVLTVWGRTTYGQGGLGSRYFWSRLK